MTLVHRLTVSDTSTALSDKRLTERPSRLSFSSSDSGLNLAVTLLTRGEAQVGVESR